MIILKLGGSIITKKDSLNPELDYDNLNRLCIEIKSSVDSGLMIVHGAGSFGHPPAKKYDIGGKVNSSNFSRKKTGFSITQNEVQKLNNLVCDCLIDNGIPAVAIQASSFIVTNNKRIEIADADLIKKFIKLGFVPVIYGDVVLDLNEDIKFAVISGDQLISYFANELNAKRVILGTDVDGVYSKNPKKHENAELIKKVSSLDDLESLDSTTNIDVTGGMVGKIKELLLLADKGIESQIINANKENILKETLENKKLHGTLIKS